MKIDVRKATMADFKELYALGLKTPELKVNNDEAFMSPKEFEWSIKNRNGIFLLAETGGRVAGFLYANAKDSDRPVPGYACLVYLVVSPRYRRKGIASRLYSDAEAMLKKRGVTYIYALAGAEDKAAIGFNLKQGFAKGNRFVWTDKKL